MAFASLPPARAARIAESAVSADRKAVPPAARNQACITDVHDCAVGGGDCSETGEDVGEAEHAAISTLAEDMVMIIGRWRIAAPAGND
jgi:hypothetical protein